MNTYTSYHIPKFKHVYLKQPPKSGKFFKIEVPHWEQHPSYFKINIGFLATFKSLAEFEKITVKQLKDALKHHTTSSYVQEFDTYEELQDFCTRLTKVLPKKYYDISVTLPKNSDDYESLKKVPKSKKEYGIPVSYVVATRAEHLTHPVQVTIKKKSYSDPHVKTLYSQLVQAYGTNFASDVFVKEYKKIEHVHNPSITLMLKSEDEIPCIMPFVSSHSVSAKVFVK